MISYENVHVLDYAGNGLYCISDGTEQGIVYRGTWDECWKMANDENWTLGMSACSEIVFCIVNPNMHIGE